MRLLKASLAITISVLAFNAHASLMQPDEYKAGNLTWLKLAETVGLSMTDFNAGVGGWNTKYRMATSLEIGQLLTSFGVAEGDTGLMIGAPGAGEFVQRIGGMAPGTIYAGTWANGNGSSGADGQGLGWYVSAYLHDEAPFQIDQCPAYFSCSQISAIRTTAAPEARSMRTGLFLVKADAPQSVPEPGTLALLGLAGGLLTYQRRRNRA